jgi:hypothetical protein
MKGAPVIGVLLTCHKHQQFKKFKIQLQNIVSSCNFILVETSDVLGQASSPEPAEPGPFKPKPGQALARACSGLRLGFRF